MSQKSQKNWLIMGICWMSLGVAMGQTITHQSTYWTRFYARIHLSPLWQIHIEADNRRLWGAKQQIQSIFHVHLHRKWRNYDAALGLSHSIVWQGALAVPEWRPFVEGNHTYPLSKRWRVAHRVRLDSRFFHNYANTQLTDGFNWTLRARYMLRTEYALSPHLTLKANGEIMYHLNDFDQYRYYGGIDWVWQKNWHLECGYLKVYQKRNNNKGYFDRDNLRLTILKDFYL